MLLAPSSFDAVDLSITPKQDDPYSIWDGTPSEYLMVPVVPMPDEAMSYVDEVTANALRSSPAGQ